MPVLYLLGQIFKVASVFCLIVASIERFLKTRNIIPRCVYKFRYCLTKHWTFTGFESKTRWIVLIGALVLAVSLKCITSVSK